MAKKRQSEGYFVVAPFKDAKQYRINGEANSYEVGDDVSKMDAERLEVLVKKGLVENRTEKEEKED